MSPAISARKFVDSAVPLTAEQERDFFGSIRLSNGVFKTTDRRRMDDVNAMVVRQWQASDARPREILDVGASSAVSTVEWVDSLAEAGFEIQAVATDLSLFSQIITLSPNHQVLVDGDGYVLQHVFFGVAIRPWRRRLDLVTGYWLLSAAANAVTRAKLRRRAENGERVMLVSRSARDHKRISFVEDDIFKLGRADFRDRFDAIRAANILNRGYFTDTLLARAVAVLKDRLAGPGSLLVVARTDDDGSNHATLFRLDGRGRFERLDKVGKGSEIEDIVLGA
jgi:hypothetical protein